MGLSNIVFFVSLQKKVTERVSGCVVKWKVNRKVKKI